MRRFKESPFTLLHMMMTHSHSSRRSSFLLLLTSSLVILSVLLSISACGDEDTKPGSPSAKARANGTGGDSTSGTDSSGAPAGVAAVVGEPVAPATQFTLKLAPHVGDEYSYRVKQKGFTEFAGKRATEEETFCFGLKVTGVNNDGSFTAEMRYDSISSRKTIPAGVVDSSAHTLAYDTRNKVDSTVPDVAQAKALIGLRVLLTISKSGEVKEVANLEPVLSAVLGKLRDSVPPQRIEQMRQMIKLTAFQAIVQQLFIQVYPDSAIQVGANWTRTDEAPLVLPIAAVPSRATIVYTLAEARQAERGTIGRVKVTLATTFPQKKMDNKQVTTILNSGKATGNGDIVLDLGTGFPVSKKAEIAMHLDVTGKAKVGPSAGKEQSLSQTKSTTTFVEMLNYIPAN